MSKTFLDILTFTNIYNGRFTEWFRWYPVRRHLAAGVATAATRSGRERCAAGRDGRPQCGPLAKEGLVPRRRNGGRLYLLVNHLKHLS